MLIVLAGCTVRCSEDVTDGRLNQISRHPSHLFLFYRVEGRLYFCLAHKPQFLSTYRDDGDSCSYVRFTGLILADTSVRIILSLFI